MQGPRKPRARPQNINTAPWPASACGHTLIGCDCTLSEKGADPNTEPQGRAGFPHPGILAHSHVCTHTCTQTHTLHLCLLPRSRSVITKTHSCLFSRICDYALPQHGMAPPHSTMTQGAQPCHSQGYLPYPLIQPGAKAISPRHPGSRAREIST